jgi:NAD(P)-dependent dehydrogenase (short-subunit alcohol dehydrogenase family)
MDHLPPGTDQTTLERILITGASGLMGRMLRERLARPGRVLRLVDIEEAVPAAPGESVEIITADITDLDAMRAACANVTAVVHLGGIPTEDTWERILHVNVLGCRQVLEAARLSGVPRVVLASSNHAVGMFERTESLPSDIAPRPDTLYGWSKAAIEALGHLYVDRHGMDVIALRIGTCLDEPDTVRALSTWLSPDDAGRLVNACLDAPSPGFRIVWGLSANTRGWWSQDAGRELGYRPVDDAERYAWKVLGAAPEPDPLVDEDLARVGGPFCRIPVGERRVKLG